MDLVVAEKPSVARDLARVLGATRRGNGCLEGPSHVVTWCIGHLVELEEPAHYDARWKPWRMDTLPMLPSRFELRPVKSSRSQWTVVRGLLRDRRFARVVNACDAGREGELIFRHCYELSGSRLPMARLWVSSLTDEALRGALARIAPGARYDALADAARCRSEADWLVGLNATRALTLAGRAGGGRDAPLLSVGRVQTPTLAMVVERERAIRGFVPKDYWEVLGDFRPAGDDAQAFRARWTHDGRTALATRALADAVAARAGAAKGSPHDARVESVEKRAQRMPPPLLFDLTTLQRRANVRFGWSAQRTLDLAQKLYETHKVITYPRTDSRHLSGDLRGELPALFAALATVPAYEGTARALARDTPRVGRRVFDDAKVSDHHAIIPTTKPPAGARLDADEGRLYDMVARSFLAAFLPDAEFELTTVVVAVGAPDGATLKVSAPDDKPAEEAPPERFVEALPAPPDRFVARGRVRRVAGWQDIAGYPDDDDRPTKDGAAQRLPPLTPGARLASRYAVETKRTQPPRRYTEATLLAAMESCGRSVDDDELRAALRESGLGTPATRASILETLLARRYITRVQKALAATPTGEAVVDAIPAPALRSPELTGRWEARLARMARGEDDRARFMDDIQGFVRELVDAMRGASVRAGGDARAASEPREGGVGREARRERDARAKGKAKAPARVKAPAKAKDAPAAGTTTTLRCPACGAGELIVGNAAWGCGRWREGCRLVVPFAYGGRRITAAQLADLVTKGRTRAAAWSDGGATVQARLELDAKATPPRLTLARTT